MGRTPLLTLPSGVVEDVSGTIAGRRPSVEDVSPGFQIALPYCGVFTWHVGRELSPVMETTGFDPADHPLFRTRSCRATPAVQRASARLRHWATADAVGATPTYLTDVFARLEGVSLCRYITQLRLARALVELQSALDLGFSSHSHFTLAFRRSFGCTLSHFRSTTRRS